MFKQFLKNSGKVLIPIIIVLLIATGVILKNGKSQPQENKQPERNPITVGVQSVEASHSINGKIKYPATIVGDQEVKILARTSGVAQSVNFDLGDQVAMGKTLIRIDDQGVNLDAGKNGFDNGQIQQLELALRQAKESLDLAQKNYDKDDSYANRTARDIAQRQYESAQVTLNSAMDSHLVTAPISGTVIDRQVSVGDSVNPGQLLATISRTSKVKVQFYVDNDDLDNLTIGMPLIVDNEGKEVSAKIINISPQADPNTRRFLIEALPDSNQSLALGTVVNVWINTKQVAEDSNNLILPLSAITVGQNEKYIFVAENGVAREVNVELGNVSGETAEVKTTLPAGSQIIVEGNKLLKDGDRIEVK